MVGSACKLDDLLFGDNTFQPVAKRENSWDSKMGNQLQCL
jgi:hypothetical protein